MIDCKRKGLVQNMKWNKYTLKTTTEATDLVSGMLMEHGIDGIEIKDNIPLSDT